MRSRNYGSNQAAENRSQNRFERQSRFYKSPTIGHRRRIDNLNRILTLRLDRKSVV